MRVAITYAVMARFMMRDKEPMLKRIQLLLLGLSFLTCVETSFAQGDRRLSHLKVAISDEGKPTEARVRLTHPNGEVPKIPEVGIGVMYGRNDAAQGYAFQPDGAFYVDGGFELDIAPGVYRLTVSKGFEYLPQEIEEEIAVPDSRVDYHAWRYKEGLDERIAETRNMINQLRSRLK